MAELAQVLMLPPPTPPQRSALPVRDATDLAVNADASTGSDNARARRFRFRVYEGGDAGETDNTRTGTARGELGRAETGRAGSGRLTLVSDSNTSTRAQTDRSRSQSGSGADAFSSNPSSTFLAQSIAQEQLGDGLYNPPNQQAAIAYTRAATALTPRASAGINLSV